MKKQLTAMALAAITAISVAGCSGQTVYEYELTYNDYSGAVETYNKELFYRNDLPSLGADPGCIYIDNEADTENYGYFYVYPTSDATYGSLGICAYRTKDFAVWEEVGPVFSPDIAGGAYGTGRPRSSTTTPRTCTTCSIRATTATTSRRRSPATPMRLPPRCS